MPAKVSVPDCLSSLLRRFRSCFTAPGYEVFTALFTGFIRSQNCKSRVANITLDKQSNSLEMELSCLPSPIRLTRLPEKLARS